MLKFGIALGVLSSLATAPANANTCPAGTIPNSEIRQRLGGGASAELIVKSNENSSSSLFVEINSYGVSGQTVRYGSVNIRVPDDPSLLNAPGSGSMSTTGTLSLNGRALPMNVSVTPGALVGPNTFEGIDGRQESESSKLARLLVADGGLLVLTVTGADGTVRAKLSYQVPPGLAKAVIGQKWTCKAKTR